MKRTNPQNNSLHKWLDLLAEALNDSGQHMGDGVVIRLPIRYSMPLMKKLIVHPYMETHYFDENDEPITSTANLSTTQMQDLHRNLGLLISELSGVHVEWPSLESLEAESIEES